MNSINQDSKRIPKTAEDKKAFKALKAQEKQQRKEKALEKSLADNNNVNIKSDEKSSNFAPCDKNKNIKSKSLDKNTITNAENKINEKVPDIVKSVEKLSISKFSNDDQKQKVQRIRSSDRVSFSESSVKCSKPEKSDKNLIRKPDSKQVSYFNHLFNPDRKLNFDKIINQIPDSKIHPAIKKFGSDLDSFKIRGSTNRCLKFFQALKQMVNDLPAKENEIFSKTFSIAFENCTEFLDSCRPLATTMSTAIDYLNVNLSTLKEENHEKSREQIIEMIDQFQTERIDVAHEGIKNLASNYVKSDSNVLVYSYSEIVFQSILEAWHRLKSTGSFQVFVVDSFPDFMGSKMMESLKKHEIPCCRTNQSSIPQIMPEISLVLLGAHSIMPNNNVVSSSGSASIANSAKSFSKPVIVCAETFKFNSQNYSDGFAFNELANPDFVVGQIAKFRQRHPDNNDKEGEGLNNWRSPNSTITVLDLLHDVIPSNLISGIICELGFISSSAVSYVSRIKQPYC